MSLLALLWACADGDPASDTAAGQTTTPIDPSTWPATLGNDRPARVVHPGAAWSGEPLPLVLLLHGYGATGEIQDAYFGYGDAVIDRQFVLVTPDGTVDDSGSRFWDSEAWCCNFGADPVDDLAYLWSLVDAAEAAFPTAHLAIAGHSNGGFMAYSLACDDPARVGRLMSLAGSTFADPSDCAADEPVDVLQVHGTADDTILYDGEPVYPGAEAVVTRWAEKAGCDGETTDGTADYDAFTSGDEATRLPRTGCGDSEVALWRLDGGSHIPALTDAWRNDSLDWLLTD